MPRPYPERSVDTYFVGAGFSAAFGLPNTAQLLAAVHDLSKEKDLALDQQLQDAYSYFYPEEDTPSYRPEVVDFFSVLRAYEDVGKGLPGGFGHPTLLDDLKFAIARLLIERTRALDFTNASEELREMIRPGKVIITSNWDTIVEWYCAKEELPLRLCIREHDENSVTLLKLHGSTDWTLRADRVQEKPRNDYAPLRERLNPPTPYQRRWGTDPVLRIRAVEHMSRGWQFVSARTECPLLATMARRKATELSVLKEIWEDAYAALGRAKTLTIVGYSMPPDDTEIRTLLRAGVIRKPKKANVIVRNPSPDVHVRLRTWVSKQAKSDYRPFSPFA